MVFLHELYVFDTHFLDEAGSIFSFKRKKPPTLFSWKKGCLPSPVRFVIQMQPQ